MPKTMSDKQLAANRRNAQKSTGPRTPAGRAVSKMNALKHGILSKEVLVCGLKRKESAREFSALHQRFRDDRQPEGPVEEMLVDQIVTAHWRLRRALTAESGEIALNAGHGESRRRRFKDPRFQWMKWRALGDPVYAMEDSLMGNGVLEHWLSEVRAAVERDGELTEATVQRMVQNFGGEANRLTRELEGQRVKLLANRNGLEESALREWRRQETLKFLDHELGLLEWRRRDLVEREESEEQAQQDAAALPSIEVLDKIMRYETKLERQMYRAMAQLERLQRLRRGEAVPAPLSVEVSDRSE